MGSNEIFGGTISILEKNLDLRSLKQNLLVSNIANKDTPNYKAFDLSLEAELEKLTENQSGVNLKKTHGAHLPATKINEDYSGIKITSTSNEFIKRGDGNTVNVEKEMTSLAENSLMYETMAQLIRKKFQALLYAIQGGK